MATDVDRPPRQETDHVGSQASAASSVRRLPIGRIVDGGTLRSPSQAEITAYDALFPMTL